jgi:hypothetical protein
MVARQILLSSALTENSNLGNLTSLSVDNKQSVLKHHSSVRGVR